MEEESGSFTRLTAFKVAVKDILEGSYVTVEGKWEPDYVLTKLGQKVSRVRVLGLVLRIYKSEDGAYAALVVDDTTGSIRAKAWRGDVGLFKELEAGDTVEVVGKIREYQEERYIAPEVVVKTDGLHELLRRLELAKLRKKLSKINSLVNQNSEEFDDVGKLQNFMKEKYGVAPEVVENIIASKKEPEVATVQPEEETSTLTEKIKLLKIIGQNPTGAPYATILQQAGMDSGKVDLLLKELISDGEIFEPRSGVFKRL